MFQLNAKTRTNSILTEAGTTVRLDHPQYLAECDGDRVPYVMPSREGGYLIFVEYGDPCATTSANSETKSGCCSDPCSESKETASASSCPPIQRLLAMEVVQYSGYQEDGVTLNIIARALEGTSKREWPAGSLVIQSMTGAELKDVLNWLQRIQTFLDELGCILAVPTKPKSGCGGWSKGEWRCYNHKYYRSKENGNCTNPPNDTWECEADVFSLLNLHCDWLKTCDNNRLPLGSRVLRLGDFLGCDGNPLPCGVKLAQCKDIPEIPEPSITDLDQEPDYETGKITIKSSDGRDTVIDVLDPKLWPSAYVRVAEPPNRGVSGHKPPSAGLIKGKATLSGGFAFNAAGNLVIPYPRRYRIQYRPAVIGEEQKLYPVGERCNMTVQLNGVDISTLKMDDHVGNHIGEEKNDIRFHHLDLKKGDVISVITEEETASHYLAAYDLDIFTLSR